MQYFKGDPIEIKFDEAGAPLLDGISADRTEFFNDAYDTAPLGDLLQVTGRAPLSNAIPNDIWRGSFAEIFNSFLLAGSAESYLTVFRKIFGENVEVTFTIPGPGKLLIYIVTSDLETFHWVGRHVEDNAYVYDNIVTQDGDQLIFQSIKGFQSEYELNAMLFEMVPAGIWTVITLTFGGA